MVDYYIDPDVVYRHFHGRELVASALTTITFFGVKNLANGTAVPDGGIDMEILNLLGKLFNFT